MLVTPRRKGGNLFVPKSDWHLISPYNIISPLVTRLSHKNKGKDHRLQKLLIINQILPVSALGKI